MQKKKGISLIVLVITIIVMIILAAAIIISLDNAGIIGKANDAVEKTNLKQVQQLASIAWAEAYADGKTTQGELEEYILEALDKNKVDKDKYLITVTEDGVDVQLKEGNLNEYGFYFEELYVIGESGSEEGYVFHSDGSAQYYATTNGIMFCKTDIPTGSITYSKGNIVFGEMSGTVSNNGTTITDTTGTLVLTCNFAEINEVYVNESYTSADGTISISLDENKIGTMINNGVPLEGEVTVTGDGHILTVFGNTFRVSVDGKHIYWVENSKLLVMEGETDNDIGALEGAIITPVEGSSVEAIKAGNPMAGDTVAYNGYIYKYNQIYQTDGNWISVTDYNDGLADERKLVDGWGARVEDETLTSYSDVKSEIFNNPVSNLALTFYGCTSLVNAPKLSSNITTGMVGTFLGCTALKSATVPENVTRLELTFYNCSSLENVTLPSTLKVLSYTFAACNSMATTPLLPEGLTEMTLAFGNCTSLKAVQNIPSTVTNLAEAFAGCEKLTDVPSIPEGVTNMYHTFERCTSLETAPAIPGNVTNLNGTFIECTSLTGTIIINATNITGYTECFYGTVKPITLVKTDCPILTELAATAINNNVTVQQ